MTFPFLLRTLQCKKCCHSERIPVCWFGSANLFHRGRRVRLRRNGEAGEAGKNKHFLNCEQKAIIQHFLLHRIFCAPLNLHLAFFVCFSSQSLRRLRYFADFQPFLSNDALRFESLLLLGRENLGKFEKKVFLGEFSGESRRLETFYSWNDEKFKECILNRLLNMP